MEKSKIEKGEFVSDMVVPSADLRGWISKYHEAGMSAEQILDLLHKHLRISDSEAEPQKSESALKNISIAEIDIAGWSQYLKDAGFSQEDADNLIARINADPELKDRLRRGVVNIPITDKSEGAVEIPVTIGKKEDKPAGTS